MRYLFVGGPQRCGTTALTRLLNAHPKIAIGVERYKYLYTDPRRHDEVGPALFAAERFLDWRPTDTNAQLAFAGDVGELKRKYPDADYRGDKIPSVMRFRELFSDRFPGCLFVIVFRDVYRACSSWNARAANPRDRWPESNDYKAAVRTINEELRRTASLYDRDPGRVLVTRYENVFGDGAAASVEALLNALDLDMHAAVAQAIERNRERARELAAKPLLEADGQRRFIERNIDWAAVSRLESLAL